MISKAEIRHLQIKIQGAVQGVGFRPFVYRLAHELGLAGWVNNSVLGVMIELEGEFGKLEEFVDRLNQEKPPHAFIHSQELIYLQPVNYIGFKILESANQGMKEAIILPDMATCPDCLSEIFDPTDRRYRYPFTNCTNCGPRYSIIELVPYDRINTTMRHFSMCTECQEEYDDPLNRRFHAQPNACPACGPHLELWNRQGTILASLDQALQEACGAISSGKIVALKGLGGFHLIVDASNEQAIKRLRLLKAREEKPLALMYPNLQAVMSDCHLSELERELLASSEAPIILLTRKSSGANFSTHMSSLVAPNNPYLGVMLPYTPLHHLLMAELKMPIVATSGNLSDEPICTDEREALTRLGEIADLFLVHDRPIARHLDDSIVRMVNGRELVLRRARGYAPLPVRLKEPLPPVLAVGGHLKNSVAIALGRHVFISQHIGDLSTPQAYEAFLRTVKTLTGLYDFSAKSLACDLHPDYLSTKYVREIGLPCVEVQHHYAHILSCMAENELDETVLGVSWDGTGLGLDGTIWGGEFLLIDEKSFRRVAHLRTFHLPGGEKAISEPRRSALGLLFEIFGERLFAMEEIAPLRAFQTHERTVLQKMLEERIGSPVTSSAGRLFDAIASLLDLSQITSFEGQAAMQLEFAAVGWKSRDAYDFGLIPQSQALVVDWEPMIHGILDDLHRSMSIQEIAAKFHNTLAEMIVAVAGEMVEKRVVLSGGCFQNKYLCEEAIRRLKAAGFEPFWHRFVPPNDGGIALGQIIAAGRITAKD